MQDGLALGVHRNRWGFGPVPAPDPVVLDAYGSQRFLVWDVFYRIE